MATVEDALEETMKALAVQQFITGALVFELMRRSAKDADSPTAGIREASQILTDYINAATVPHLENDPLHETAKEQARQSVDAIAGLIHRHLARHP